MANIEVFQCDACKKLTRYDQGYYRMEEAEDGMYVEYDDVVELEDSLKTALAEIERLKHIMNELDIKLHPS